MSKEVRARNFSRNAWATTIGVLGFVLITIRAGYSTYMIDLYFCVLQYLGVLGIYFLMRFFPSK